MRRLFSLASFLALILGAGVPLPAAQDNPQVVTAPQVAPVLRLETGLHMAAIRALSVSADGGLALTAAEDKSARLWELATGRLLRTIRPTVEGGKVGMLYACTLSSDGKLAALGGWTKSARDGGHRILLVDARTGGLVRILEVGPQVVNFLAFSPDGQRLVAHLGGNLGLRMFRVSDGAPLGGDADYAQPSYRGAFDPQGRYAASSDDGYLRLYDAAFKRTARAKAPAANPFGLAFSPDGNLLALAYADSPRVEVLNASTLGVAYTPSAGAHKLGLVAWSRDGRTLFASGGEDFGSSPNVLRRWTLSGRGEARETDLAQATVSELTALPDGGLAYASQDPAWGVLEASGAPRFQKAVHQADLRAARAAFRIDGEATQVALPGRIPGLPSAAFSLLDLDLLAQAPQRGPRLEGLQLAGWRDGREPTLKGQALPLEDFETSRSLDIAPDGNGFLLGTDWYLRAYDAQGKLRWKLQTPASVWGLCTRLDGQVVVAMLADGSFRWYRTEDGHELMGLYVGADRRWISWTPSGAFGASPGGETLAGWQVNRVDRAGDFFPMSHFRDRFYRPELLPQLLDTLDEGAALQRLQSGNTGAPISVLPSVQELPPVLSILSPSADEPLPPGLATFQVELRSLGSAKDVKEFQVFLDGQRMPALRGLRAQQSAILADGVSRTYSVAVQLPPRDVTVDIQAELDNGQFSERASQAVRIETPSPVPAEIPVQLAPQVTAPPVPVSPPLAQVPVTPPAVQQAAPEPPTLRMLAVGIQRFVDPKNNLKFTVKDATDIAQFFKGQEGRLYRKVDLTVLVDEQATAKRLLEAMDRIKSAAKPGDVTLFFFSTHGGSNAEKTSYSLISYDYGQGSRGVDGAEIKARLKATQGKVVLLMDTCHSGNVLGTGSMRDLGPTIQRTRFINELIQAGPGMVVLSSSSGAQYSLESAAWNNGAFTKALREGLSGAADPKHTGRITTEMLETYVRKRVAELTNGRQTPVAATSENAKAFPIALR